MYRLSREMASIGNVSANVRFALVLLSSTFFPQGCIVIHVQHYIDVNHDRIVVIVKLS